MRTLRWALLLLFGPLALCQSDSLKINPAYPVVMGSEDVGTKEIHVTYFPQSPHAKIKDPQQLVLKVGINGRFWRENATSVPLVRNDNGAWEATLSRQDTQFWLYLLFMVKDEKTGQVDDNGGQYWEVLFYFPRGQPHPQAIEFQAESYAGTDFENGIARKPDYAKATAILEQYLAGADPNRYNILFRYWQYKLQALGGNDEAWRKIAAEIDYFLTDHQFEESPLMSASGFVLNNQAHLPPVLLARNLELIDRLDPAEATKIHRMAIFAALRTEKNKRKRADDLGAFVTKYPHEFDAGLAADERFRVLRELGDVPGAESAFQQRLGTSPEWADNYAAMAAVYIENKVKLDTAQQLLEKARLLLKGGDQGPKGGRFYLEIDPDSKRADASLAYWQARLYLLQGKGELALPLAQQALESIKSGDRRFVLAQAYEAVGQKDKALDAYLETVLVPSRDQRERMERLEKFWASAGFGNSDQLFERIEALQQHRFKNAHYVPALIDRPAPEFEFTTLKGEKFRSSDLADKTVVLNFWATWCAPCIPELPGFQKLQSKHPELVVGALAIHSDAADLDELVRKQKLDTLLIAQADNLADAFAPNGVPVTYVVDHGRLRVIHRAPIGDVVAYIEADLAAIKAPVASR